MLTLDHALDVVMQLDDDERDLLVEIMQKRQVEARRDEIAQYAREAMRAFHAGELRTETAEQLINRLHPSLDASPNDPLAEAGDHRR
jgi:hypothetical protein